jgi:hypothetical protein
MALPKEKIPISVLIVFLLCASYGFILSYLIWLGILSQIKSIIPLLSILLGIGIFGNVFAFYKQKSLGIAFDSIYKGIAVGIGAFTICSLVYQFFFT